MNSLPKGQVFLIICCSSLGMCLDKVYKEITWRL
jgi:hypothetical protein